ncbi:MAG: folate family ECF transporter S component [Clostridiales bacterium]|nr:folate family ECF transporter S component [Clostridiales bacterium]
MKKFAALFSDSYRELRSTRAITVAAMFGAVSVVLGYFTITVGDYVKIGFSSIAGQIVYYLFGPVLGGVFGGAMDVVKYLIKPTGPYFPGFTIDAAVAGLIYGCVYYRRTLTLRRVLAAEFLVCLVCNVFLATFWLSVLYGKGFFMLLPMRVLKNLIMWPINSLLFYTAARGLEGAGVLRPLSS